MYVLVVVGCCVRILAERYAYVGEAARGVSGDVGLPFGEVVVETIQPRGELDIERSASMRRGSRCAFVLRVWCDGT